MKQLISIIVLTVCLLVSISGGSEPPLLTRVASANSIIILDYMVPDGIVGSSYSYQFTAVGGSPPYEWRAPCKLPDGLYLSSRGLLYGTPTSPYDFWYFIIQVRGKQRPAWPTVFCPTSN